MSPTTRNQSLLTFSTEVDHVPHEIVLLLIRRPQQLKREMSSPSHGSFVTSTIVFVLTLAWIIHDRQEDKFQDHFLFIGGFFGAFIGIMTGYDTQGIMLSILPATILAALVLSVVLHMTWGHMNLVSDGNIVDEDCKKSPHFHGKYAHGDEDEDSFRPTT